MQAAGITLPTLLRYKAVQRLSVSEKRAGQARSQTNEGPRVGQEETGEENKQTEGKRKKT